MSQSLAAAVFCLVTFIGAVNGADEKSPKFTITSKRDTDKLEVKVEKDKTIFSVTSPAGISEATIGRMDETWPDIVVLRLQLKGLESLHISNGKVSLNASVSSHDEKHPVRLWKDGKESALLDSKDPFWMDIGMIGGDGKPSKDIPLKDGYFEMQLPKTFLESNPKSITVKWIDFYRN